jgi:hypothetical protein
MQMLFVVGISLLSMSLVASLKMKSIPVTRLLTRCFAAAPPMTKELLREGFISKNASSLFLLDTSKFGLDMALADGKSYYSNDVTSKV